MKINIKEKSKMQAAFNKVLTGSDLIAETVHKIAIKAESDIDDFLIPARKRSNIIVEYHSSVIKYNADEAMLLKVTLTKGPTSWFLTNIEAVKVKNRSSYFYNIKITRDHLEAAKPNYKKYLDIEFI